ncbi:PREDICTED: PRAME family member 22-like [Chinchilla lanigera]|uniref:PRAME family member 22-like n=1 Tax=Chinchilla lanigera TaxID=34839 RepID=UPI000699075A|nr:PREDICTED: PRAME family member 22-like [Chinchilla lanigera]
MEAFTSGHGEVLKAIVLSWPFPCLPLGTLMSLRNGETLDIQVDDGQMQERMFHAVVDGLDVLLSQKVRSRRLKLQVLDTRVKHQNLWRVWAGSELQVCSKEAIRRRKTEVPGSRGAKRQPLKVTIDLHLTQGHLCPEESYLLKWARAREDLVQLERGAWGHCGKLFTLAQFAPLLGQMQKLHNLIVSDVSVLVIISPEKIAELLAKSPQSPGEGSAPRGAGDQMEVQGSEAEGKEHSPESLQILLKKVAATVTALHLENCGITDAQVCAILPFLSCCSQLTTFGFTRNFMSIDTMRKLLGHTTRLSNLTLELYSSPPELFVSTQGVNQQLWNQLHEELRRIVKALNHPRTVYFCTFHCEVCCCRKVHNKHSPR